MLRLIFFLIIAAIVSAIGIWLADQSGTVVISWPEVLGSDWPMPVGLAVVLAVVLALAAVVIFEVLRLIFSAPKKIIGARDHRKELKGYQEVSSGLMAVAAGDLAAARQHNRNAEKLLSQSAASLLLSAQTAQLEGKEDVAQIKFKQMRESAGGELLGLRGLLAQAIKGGDREEALSLANQAYRRSPTTPWVLTTYYDLLTRAGAWKQALNVITEMTRQNVVDKETSRKYRSILNHQIARNMRQAGDLGAALEMANQATHLEPGFVPAATERSAIAAALGRTRLAKQSVLRCWRINAHPELAEAYSKLAPNETPEGRLKRFRSLYEQRPNEICSKMVMARLSMAAKDWAGARRFLDKAVEIGPTSGVFRLLAELEKSTGASAEKVDALNAKAAEAKPDPAWVCEDTGEVSPTWEPFGTSGRFGSVIWTDPPAVTTMLSHERPAFALVHDGVEVSSSGGSQSDRAQKLGSGTRDHQKITEAISGQSDTSSSVTSRGGHASRAPTAAA